MFKVPTLPGHDEIEGGVTVLPEYEEAESEEGSDDNKVKTSNYFVGEDDYQVIK